jgi:TATA-box binding protein (TBP) (component of TFIID and TFIIIB)
MAMTTEFLDTTQLPAALSISTISVILRIGRDTDKVDLSPLIEGADANPSIKPCAFHNAVATRITVRERSLYMKVFENGKIHGAGFKDLDEINTAVRNLLEKLRLPLLTTPVSEARIIMMNAVFHLPFCLNRDKLFHILKRDGIACKYDPSEHSAVRIFLPMEGKVKPVVIMVFEKGSVIIAGTTQTRHLIDAHGFVMETIAERYRNSILRLRDYEQQQQEQDQKPKEQDQKHKEHDQKQQEEDQKQEEEDQKQEQEQEQEQQDQEQNLPIPPSV